MYRRFVKRGFDVLLSAIALIILSPIILIIAILVRVFMGAPVIFKQERAGKDNKRFYIYKFKTMRDIRDENGDLLPDEQRKCRFGEILRSTSLDELPELWNIFVGDMSIIGPRPLYMSYIPYYKESERARNTVRGGLVPPEVLSYDLTPTWDSQLKSEAEYAENITFLTDLKIFFATFVVLFKRMRYNYGEYVREPLDKERAKRIEDSKEETLV